MYNFASWLQGRYGLIRSDQVDQVDPIDQVDQVDPSDQVDDPSDQFARVYHTDILGTARDLGTILSDTQD